MFGQSILRKGKGGINIGATKTIGVDGEEVIIESREDEEQKIKYGEIIELLLAAGYFRARISTLTPFDRVIGGLAWCLINSAVNVDIDVVFIENASIGQKITLSEKIVRALQLMKCPIPLEPHQIQGSDFKSIFPVLQWLVKRVLETRAEMGDYIRHFSVSQFAREHQTPDDIQMKESFEKGSVFMSSVTEKYKSHRQFRPGHRVNARYNPKQNISDTIEATLLEYGHRSLSIVPKGKKADDKTEETTEERRREQELEKKRINALIEQMNKVDLNNAEGASSRAVGNILELESESIAQFAIEYAKMQQELAEGQEKVGGAQAHKREVASLEKQIALQESKLNEVKDAHDKLLETFNEYQAAVAKAIKYNNRVIRETAKLDELETPENAPILAKFRSMLSMIDTLELQTEDFKTSCREHAMELRNKIEGLSVEGEENTDTQRVLAIEAQWEADNDKLRRSRKALSKKKREIALVERQMDQVASRAELAQYQKRFLELYTQVASKFSETRQFYDRFNTLDARKIYTVKEISLLNSIFDNFEKARQTKGGQDKFLDSMEIMLKSVNDILGKLDDKYGEDKKNKDSHEVIYMQLLEKQRLYFKTVLDFQEECRRNEILTQQYSQLQSAANKENQENMEE